MKRIVATLICMALLGTGIVNKSLAEDYVNGIEGIKAASLPGPGFYYRLYNVFYSADEIKDSNGDDLVVPEVGEVGFDVEVYAQAHRFLWMSNKKILGADFGMNAVVPLISVDYGIDRPGAMPDENVDESLALGDIAIDPFMLSWHKERFDACFALGFFVPTGDFDKARTLSIGKDHWTTMLTFGGTYYLDHDKAWSASALGRYEKHFKDESQDITRGDDFHVEFGVGKNIRQIFDVGLAGYAQWQVTDDKGSEVAQLNTTNDNEVYALGPEVNAFIPPWMLQITARVLKEFSARNRPEGTKGVLTLTKIF